MNQPLEGLALNFANLPKAGHRSSLTQYFPLRNSRNLCATRHTRSVITLSSLTPYILLDHYLQGLTTRSLKSKDHAQPYQVGVH